LRNSREKADRVRGFGGKLFVGGARPTQAASGGETNRSWEENSKKQEGNGEEEAKRFGSERTFCLKKGWRGA